MSSTFPGPVPRNSARDTTHAEERQEAQQRTEASMGPPSQAAVSTHKSCHGECSRTSRAGAAHTVTLEGQPHPPSQMPTTQPSSLPRGGCARCCQVAQHPDICGSREGKGPTRCGEQSSDPPGCCSQAGPQRPAGHSGSPGENFTAGLRSPRSAPRHRAVGLGLTPERSPGSRRAPPQGPAHSETGSAGKEARRASAR